RTLNSSSLTLLLHTTLAQLHSSTYPPNNTVPTETPTLSLHDALPISATISKRFAISSNPSSLASLAKVGYISVHSKFSPLAASLDRKSTRLNSSHVSISYAVFCLKKKNKLILS